MINITGIPMFLHNIIIEFDKLIVFIYFRAYVCVFLSNILSSPFNLKHKTNEKWKIQNLYELSNNFDVETKKSIRPVFIKSKTK